MDVNPHGIGARLGVEDDAMRDAIITTHSLFKGDGRTNRRRCRQRSRCLLCVAILRFNMKCAKAQEDEGEPGKGREASHGTEPTANTKKKVMNSNKE